MNMTLELKFGTGFLAGAISLGSVGLAQEKPAGQDMKPAPGMSMQEPMQHQHGDVPLVKPEYPQMGRAQERAGAQVVTLEQAEKMAAETNPTLRQAEAEIRAAKARQQQAGLYPNPSVGYTGDEIRGGSVGGGKQGFFVQQTIVMGGKLGKSRAVFGAEAKLAEIEAQEQQTRVETAVKMAFLRVLAAQEWLDARRDLAKIAENAAQTQRELMNTGQADESEVLEAEVEAKRMRMAARPCKKHFARRMALAGSSDRAAEYADSNGGGRPGEGRAGTERSRGRRSHREAEPRRGDCGSLGRPRTGSLGAGEERTFSRRSGSRGTGVQPRDFG
jgi:hypothetical protein